MTEMEQGAGLGSPSAAVPVEPSSTPKAPAEERTFRQSEINDIVGRAKHEAVERYKRESSVASHAHQQPPAAAAYRESYAPPSQPLQYNGMSENEYRRIAAEEAAKARQGIIDDANRKAEEHAAERIASEFVQKMGTGEGGFQSFQKLCAEAGVDLQAIPFHVQLANMVDNTKDVMTELVNNPVKIGQLQNLIDIDIRAGRQPNLALSEMKRMSQALKANANASNFKSPNEPLSQMRPSNAGTGIAGPLNASDYRKRYKV